MSQSFLTVEQKRGVVEKPIGLMTVYARVSSDAAALNENNPLAAIVQNGLLVAQGNYRDQRSLRDFLQQELGTSLDDEEGIKAFVENLGGIEGALDPEKFQEKLAQIEDMEEFIPTPAKMSSFESEEAILNEEGDIFFAGTFENSANANLAINAIAILYQARFRETQIDSLRGEIDGMILQLEPSEETPSSPTSEQPIEIKLAPRKTTTENLSAQEILHESLTRYIPPLIATQATLDSFSQESSALQQFLSLYSHSEDIDQIIERAKRAPQSAVDSQVIELLLKKISFILCEEFDKVPEVVQQLTQLSMSDK